MKRNIQLLTTAEIDAAAPRATPYKLNDGGGLILEVRPTGNKYWRYRYRIAGKENTFGIGEYGKRADQVTLAAARDARAVAARTVKLGEHPRAVERRQFAARVEENKATFAAVAADWLDTKRGNIGDDAFDQLETSLLRDVSPYIGEFPVRAITTRQILELVQRRVDAPHMAKIAFRVCTSVFSLAVMTDRADTDPCYPLRNIFRERVIAMPKKENHPWLRGDEIPAFLTAIAEAPERFATIKHGVRILLLTMVRPNELAGAHWSEFDLDNAVWSVPGERMKMEKSHIVPLSRQAVDELRALHKLTGDRPVLFPDDLARVRKGDAVTKLPRIFVRFINETIGYGGKLTAHGLRATASTMLNNVTRPDGSRRFDKDWIECQLSHLPQGVRAHYNHASYLEQRADMMQAYADMVMPRGKVVPMPKRKAA